MEMPGKYQIMRAIRKGLDRLELIESDNTVWTKAHCYQTVRDWPRLRLSSWRSGGRSEPQLSQIREWLYDVTWLEYNDAGRGLGSLGCGV